MERIEYLRSVIKRIIGEQLEATPDEPSVDTLAIQDDESGNYLLVEVGWQSPRRIYNVIFHLHLKEGKIWVEQDWTEDGIANHLLTAGIQPEEIELGFQSPTMRAYIEWPTVAIN